MTLRASKLAWCAKYLHPSAMSTPVVADCLYSSISYVTINPICHIKHSTEPSCLDFAVHTLVCGILLEIVLYQELIDLLIYVARKQHVECRELGTINNVLEHFKGLGTTDKVKKQVE